MALELLEHNAVALLSLGLYLQKQLLFTTKALRAPIYVILDRLKEVAADSDTQLQCTITNTHR